MVDFEGLPPEIRLNVYEQLAASLFDEHGLPLYKCQVKHAQSARIPSKIHIPKACSYKGLFGTNKFIREETTKLRMQLVIDFDCTEAFHDGGQLKQVTEFHNVTSAAKRRFGDGITHLHDQGTLHKAFAMGQLLYVTFDIRHFKPWTNAPGTAWFRLQHFECVTLVARLEAGKPSRKLIKAFMGAYEAFQHNIDTLAFKVKHYIKPYESGHLAASLLWESRRDRVFFRNPLFGFDPAVSRLNDWRGVQWNAWDALKPLEDAFGSHTITMLTLSKKQLEVTEENYKISARGLRSRRWTKPRGPKTKRKRAIQMVQED